MTALLELTQPQPVKLTIEDYTLLDRSGALDRYVRTELIEGTIVSMNAQYRPHAHAKSQLAFRLLAALKDHPDGWSVIIEASVAMPPTSMPMPDIILTTEPMGDGAIPLTSVGLLVEVADTTLDFDLRRKASLYARMGVPEYWVVDVKGRTIELFTQPRDDGYAERRQIAFGEPIVSATIAGLEIGTEQLA